MFSVTLGVGDLLKGNVPWIWAKTINLFSLLLYSLHRLSSKLFLSMWLIFFFCLCRPVTVANIHATIYCQNEGIMFEPNHYVREVYSLTLFWKHPAIPNGHSENPVALSQVAQTFLLVQLGVPRICEKVLPFTYTEPDRSASSS